MVGFCGHHIYSFEYILYSNVEKPTSGSGASIGGSSGDVNGGNNKYDYRPSTTLDNRRRKYNNQFWLLNFLFYQVKLRFFQ